MDKLVKISRDTALSEEANIYYRHNSPGTPAGLFSFTYYVPFTKQDASAGHDKYKGYIYADGIERYLEMLDTYEAEWKDWKIVLYMDQITLERGVAELIIGHNEKKHAARRAQFLEKITRHPKVILAIVRWDRYKMDDSGEEVAPHVLRCFRFKAFEDFPGVPVFVRDADTIFIQNDDRGRAEFRPGVEVKTIHEWEYEYYWGFKAKEPRYRFCLATENVYTHEWHVYGDREPDPPPFRPLKWGDPPLIKLKRPKPSMLGFMAGVIGSLGHIPMWKNGTLWQKSIDYMVEKSNVVYNPYSRMYVFTSKRRFLALDEPILAYVILPELYDITFFFFNEFAGSDEAIFKSPRFPDILNLTKQLPPVFYVEPNYKKENVLAALKGFKSAPLPSTKDIARNNSAALKEMEDAIIRKNPSLWVSPAKNISSNPLAAGVRYAFSSPLPHTFLKRLIKYLMRVNVPDLHLRKKWKTRKHSAAGARGGSRRLRR
jgi:hypothetical protein